MKEFGVPWSGTNASMERDQCNASEAAKGRTLRIVGESRQWGYRIYTAGRRPRTRDRSEGSHARVVLYRFGARSLRRFDPSGFHKMEGRVIPPQRRAAEWNMEDVRRDLKYGKTPIAEKAAEKEIERVHDVGLKDDEVFARRWM